MSKIACLLAGLLVACADSGVPDATDSDSTDTDTDTDTDTSSSSNTDTDTGTETLDRTPPVAPLTLGLAGAPVELFGTLDAPSFDAPFRDLSDAHVDAFFPLFLTSEVDGVATTTGHEGYFVAPEMFGLPADSGCVTHDPYAAAAGKLEVWFPGFFLMELQDRTLSLDEVRFREDLAQQHDTCWADHPGVVTAFHTYDEPALFYAVERYLGYATTDMSNIGAAAQIVREELDLPTVWVEGPGPELFDALGLPARDVDQLRSDFEAALADVGDVEVFGYDVYPIPELAPTAPGDFTADASARAPDTRTLSVLQAFGFERMTGGVTAGPRPTADQLRFHAVDSLAAGATDLVWYGASSLVLSDAGDAALWADLKLVIGELHQGRDLVDSDTVTMPDEEGLRRRWTVTADGFGLIVANVSGAPWMGVLTPPSVVRSVEVVSATAGASASLGGGVDVTLPVDGAMILRLVR